MSRVTYPLVINGFTISADYEQEDVETIFLPLLRKLSEFQKEKKRRLLVFLAAPPAVGKSTLASVLPICPELMNSFVKYRISD